MQVMWPAALLLLGLPPLLVGLYLWVLRRRRRYAVRFSSLALVREALPRYSQLRRHLPFALLLLALASLSIAMARPVATVQVPSGRATIVLAMDVSRSMLANDIPPNRIAAAQQAALSFVERQEAGTQIAIVAFAGFAELVQQPTSDQEALETAIASLTTGRGTAIGSGIAEALDVIAGRGIGLGSSSADLAAGPAVPPGGYVPDIVVLLTDGVTTTGPAPLDVAEQAAARGVRVYTIGFGTENGGMVPGGGFGQGGGGGGFGGGRFRRGIDEATLQQIAEMTGGAYYVAESADELQQVFRELPLSLATRQETTEVSFAFVALGTLLSALAVGLSLRWNRFP
jgi:Ca-activated chloride channel family protein